MMVGDVDSAPEPTAQLYPCVPSHWQWLPRPARLALGYMTLMSFISLFFSIPFCLLLLLVPVVRDFCGFWVTTSFLGAAVVSLAVPQREWPWWRRVPQLWYEIFDFSANKSPAECDEMVRTGAEEQFLICMHPHGVVPLQAFFWVAYCDDALGERELPRGVPRAGSGVKQDTAVVEPTEMLSSSTSSSTSKTTTTTYYPGLYGFGAGADVLAYIPFLRNVLGWVAAGSASKRALLDGLAGKLPACNRVGRRPKHLFIFPGGIAELFSAKQGTHRVIVRGGLMRLALETGATLVPAYVFGGNDFFHNLATYFEEEEDYESKGAHERDRLRGEASKKIAVFGRWLASVGRRLQTAVTFFWGRFGLPILPFSPRVSLVIGDGILVQQVTGEIDEVAVEALRSRYLEGLTALFEKYKAVAGYPDACLEIL